MDVPDPEFERLLREEEELAWQEVPIKIGRLYAWRAFSLEGSEYRDGYYDHQGRWVNSRYMKLDLYPLVHAGETPYSLIGINDYRDVVPPQATYLSLISQWDTTITETNHAGFWAFKTKTEALNYLNYQNNRRIIHGLVELSGETVVYDNGYRSEFLEVLALVSFANAKARRAIAHKLGWPGKIHPVTWGKEFYPFQEEGK